MNFPDARSLNARGAELQAQGLCHEAREAFAQAAVLYEAQGDVRGQARCVNGVGACCKDLGQTAEALRHLERALPLRRQAGDLLGEAITLTTLGPVYQAVGRHPEAEQALRRALELTTSLGYENRRGQVLHNLAQNAMNRGQWTQAMQWYREASAIALDDPVESTKCLGGFVRTLMALGRDDEARRHADELLVLAAKIGNARGASTAHHDLGLLAHNARDFERARKHLEKSVEIDLHTGARGEAAVTLAALAGVWSDLGDSSEALRAADRALALVRDGATAEAEIAAHWIKGSLLLFDQNDAPSALEHLQHALQAAQRAGDEPAQGKIRGEMAIALELAGRRSEALACLEKAATLCDALRGNLRIEEHRRSFFSQREVQNVYAIFTDLLMREFRATGDRAYAERAFEARERSRTRALLDHLQTKGSGVVSAAGPRPISLKEAVTLSDDKTALISYSLHQKICYAWVIRDGAWNVVELSGAESIQRVAWDFRQAIHRHEGPAFQASAYALYSILLRPLEGHLEGLHNLVFITDEFLSTIPFAALLRHADDPSSYLIRDFAVSSAPSASLLALARAGRRTGASRATRDFLGLAPVCDAEPPHGLPHTRQEVSEIASLFDPPRASVLLGSAATKEALSAGNPERFRYVHFATHGHYDMTDPEGATLMLHGPEAQRYLRPSDVSDLSLSADLVVLSACSSAIGMASRGEGLMGMARAFLCAGTAAVCASLWPVNDEATTVLMRRFYTHLLGSGPGASATAALRQAQLEMIASEQWCLPDYWAAFVLIGAADQRIC